MKRRTITSEFWSRGSGKRLRGDALGQTIAHYLCNGCMSDWTGVYHVTIGTICDETGHARDEVTAALDRIAKAGFGFYDAEAELAWVPNLAERELGGPLKQGDRRRKAIERHLSSLPDHRFVHAFRARYLDAPSHGASDGASGRRAPEHDAPSHGALRSSLLPHDGSGSGSGSGNGGGSGSWAVRDDEPPSEPPLEPPPPEWARVLRLFDDAWETAHQTRLGLHGGSDNPRRAAKALEWAREADPDDPWRALRASAARFASDADERVRHPFAVWSATPGRWYGRGPLSREQRDAQRAELQTKIRWMRQHIDALRRSADPATPDGIEARDEADRYEVLWRGLCAESKALDGDEHPVDRPGPRRVTEHRGGDPTNIAAVASAFTRVGS